MANCCAQHAHPFIHIKRCLCPLCFFASRSPDFFPLHAPSKACTAQLDSAHMFHVSAAFTLHQKRALHYSTVRTCLTCLQHLLAKHFCHSHSVHVLNVAVASTCKALLSQLPTPTPPTQNLPARPSLTHCTFSPVSTRSTTRPLTPRTSPTHPLMPSQHLPPAMA
eukprot:1159497-Pelagomonas_calceolata.AAC.8